MTNASADRDAINIVESRIERKRELLVRDWRDTRSYVAQRNRLTPLTAVAVAAAFGFGMARLKLFHALPSDRVVVRRGGFAALAAMIGGALRIVNSPAGRALWAEWKRGASRPR